MLFAQTINLSSFLSLHYTCRVILLRHLVLMPLLFLFLRSFSLRISSLLWAIRWSPYYVPQMFTVLFTICSKLPLIVPFFSTNTTIPRALCVLFIPVLLISHVRKRFFSRFEHLLDVLSYLKAIIFLAI